MSKFAGILLIALLILVACQKENSDPSNRTVNTDSLFAGMLKKKIIDNISGDKWHVEYEYFYDSDRRLARVETHSEIDSLGQIKFRFTNSIVFRDNLGRTVRIADSALNVVQIIEYDGNSHKVKKKIDGNGYYYHEYFYGTNNQYERINHYSQDTSLASGYYSYAYSTYKYDNAGNNIKIEYYYDYYRTGIYVLDTKVDYIFDDKINPESLIYEDGLSGFIFVSASPNNILKEYVEWTMQSPTHDTVRNTYTYDTLNRPVISVSNINTETKYFYY